MNINKFKSDKIFVFVISLAIFLTGNVSAGINDVDSKGRTALMNNVIAGNMQAVQDLVSRGASINWRDQDGLTALMYAIICKRPAIAKFLLEQRNTDIYCQDNRGNNALVVALFESDWEMVKILLDKGLTTGWRNKSGSTLVSAKIWMKKYNDALKIVELFAQYPSRENKSQLNEPDEDGDSPLHAAVLAVQPNIVKALLQAGATARCNKKNMLPMHYAIVKNSPEIVSLLVEYGEDAEIHPTPNTYSPVEFAIVKGNIAIVKAMINGYDKYAVKMKSKRSELKKKTLVVLAIKKKQPRIADLLLASGAEIPSDYDIAINVGDNWKTAHPEAYKVICKARLGGSDFKVPNDIAQQRQMCETAIMLDRQDILDKVLNDDKCTMGNESLVALFRKTIECDNDKIAAYLYDFVAAQISGWEMYNVAMVNGSEKCFNFMLQKKIDTGLGKDATLRNSRMETYHLSTMKGGSVAILKYLQSCGAKINMIYPVASLIGMSRTSPSSLMVAAAHGRLEMVKYLIANGADPKYYTIGDLDALQLAVLAGAPEVCSYLLSKGANPNLVNQFNENSVILAKKCKNKKIEDILIKAGGISNKMRLKAIYNKQELERRNKR